MFNKNIDIWRQRVNNHIFTSHFWKDPFCTLTLSVHSTWQKQHFECKTVICKSVFRPSYFNKMMDLSTSAPPTVKVYLTSSTDAASQIGCTNNNYFNTHDTSGTFCLTIQLHRYLRNYFECSICKASILISFSITENRNTSDFISLRSFSKLPHFLSAAPKKTSCSNPPVNPPSASKSSATTSQNLWTIITTRPSSRGLFNNLHISDTPPGLRPCEKGRRKWRRSCPSGSVVIRQSGGCCHKNTEKASSCHTQPVCFTLDIKTKKNKKVCTHQMEVPYLNWLACLHWPCRPLPPLKHEFLNPLFFFSSSNARCKMWKFGAGCCSVRRVLLVQGKAGVAAVILLIFLIWANVGGEVKQ